tara:strand:+ start:44 stop:769 length:726 start_codon:yes stop_codon:yes gene_type:complete
MEKIKFPTEIIDLPSKGLIYPEGHPLRKGTIEVKYMTAKEEDILTNQNYIENGTVLDKLLESLVIGDIELNDMFPGDKNALFIGARILGYGSEYGFTYNNKEYTIDLSTFENKEFDSSLVNSKGHFSFTLPKSKTELQFKLLTDKDETKIEEEIKGLKKINKNNSSEVTTRLKHQIISLEGNTDPKEIRNFVDNYLLAQDARALRAFIKKISPNVDMIYITDSGEEVEVPIGLTFFWPDVQ